MRLTTIACPRLGPVIYAAGKAGIVYRSLNRGLSFQAARTGIPATGHIQELSFPSRDTGFTATSQGVYATQDGARSWYLLDVSRPAKEVSFHEGSFGIYLADTGRFPVSVSHDGGLNWQAQPLESRRARLQLVSVAMSREGRAFVLGLAANAPGFTRDSVYYLSNPYPSLPTAIAERGPASTLRPAPNPAQDQAQLSGLGPKAGLAAALPHRPELAIRQRPGPSAPARPSPWHLPAAGHRAWWASEVGEIGSGARGVLLRRGLLRKKNPTHPPSIILSKTLPPNRRQIAKLPCQCGETISRRAPAGYSIGCILRL